MKNCAADGRRRRHGFVLIYVLVAASALMALLALALDAAQNMAEENAAAARRIRIENAAAQASAIAEAWFCENAAAITSGTSFAEDASPESDPTPDVPSGIFSALRELYPQYEIECLCYDLHYPDSFADRAYAARVPRIAPRTLDDGGAERAYYIKTTVTEIADENYKSSVTLSMRVKKSAAGIISARRIGSTE